MTTPSAPLQAQKFSQVFTPSCSISSRMRVRSEGFFNRSTAAGAPPSCTHGGRSAPIIVLPAV